MKLTNVLFLLSLIPSVLSAGHDAHSSSDDAHGMYEDIMAEVEDPEMVEGVVAELAGIGTDVSTAMLTEIASEVVNMTPATTGLEGVSDIANRILSAIAAVEAGATGVPGGASDLVQQVIYEILGTASPSPTPAPTVFEAEEPKRGQTTAIGRKDQGLRKQRK